MEDENGLELSLGLPWCRSSAESKDKNDNLSDSKTDEGDRSYKLINDFKNFLEGGTRKQESGTTSQRSDPTKPDPTDVDASKSLNGRGLWSVNDYRGAEAEEEKRSEAGNKRKSLFDEISNQKKRESDKTKPSHFSITTDDGSTAEIEDVADSEVEGSSSRLVSHHDDATKKYMGGAGPSEVSKEVHTVIDSSVVDLQGQKRFTISSEKEFKVGNVPYGVPFQTQSVNIMTVPFPLPVKESNSIGVPNTSGYPLPSMVQVMASTNSERPGTQSVMPGNLPMMFGYSPVQLPVLDKDNSQGLASHPQQLHPSFIGRVLPNSDKQNDALKISQAVAPAILQKSTEASQYTGRALEQAKGDGKQHLANGGSSAPAEDGSRGGSAIFGTKDDSEKSRAGLLSEVSAIRQGIAADLKFGGSGSCPDLPWVSTKGPGPNGKTISGVTYQFSATQIKIVCACHGSHLSLEEFVRHASEEPSTLESNNPPTSAPS